VNPVAAPECSDKGNLALDRDSQPLMDKKGKARTRTVYEVWKADSGNAQSGAAGLKQFLGSIWLGHVLIPGYYIHDESKKAGWVRLVDVPKHGKQWMFVLADGKTTATPYGNRQDANVKACLAMRMDPTWSVNAAADYGNANLKLLKTKGFKLDGLGDMDKAKLMYLMHHEGEGAGPAFISDTLAPTAAEKAGLRGKFVQQMGGHAARVDELISQSHEDVEKAYRKWLAGYVDGKFSEAAKFFCSQAQKSLELSDLMDEIGGEGL
jgi:hypothetical protein